MSDGGRVGAFLVGLLVVAGAGAGVGALAGPIDTAPDDHGAATADHGEGPGDAGPADGPHASAGHGGASDGESPANRRPTAPGDDTEGHRLELAPLGAALSFRVLGPDGRPVVAAEERHDRPLHLIVVGRDLVTYAHLHPTVADDGTWSTPAPDLGPGSYRVVADLVPVGGPELAVAADLTVPGAATSPTPPPASRTATVDDLTVEMAGTPAVGDSDLTFTVRRGDEVVTPEPYLGARGHLVAFRTSDLAYSHVHPHGDATAVAFTATFATPGAHRLFLDVQVDGVVRTAAFTVVVPGDDGAAPDEGAPATTTPDEPPPAEPVPTAPGHEEGDHEHG